MIRYEIRKVKVYKPTMAQLKKLTGSTTITEAAKKIGVDRSLLRRWTIDGISVKCYNRYLKKFDIIEDDES